MPFVIRTITSFILFANISGKVEQKTSTLLLLQRSLDLNQNLACLKGLSNFVVRGEALIYIALFTLHSRLRFHTYKYAMAVIRLGTVVSACPY